ncbi:MAG: hypothetical protein GY789_04030 [Hyphomicrobiales bacterium]|nr:hypothetical protein [Hyphomicrobiales bacterium]MCP4998428.1 hypothetical protein [Hyphomicrobiales bacterium]
MQKILSWIKDLFWITAITFCLLALVNILMVYFSPLLVPHVGPKIVEMLDPCYRSLYQDDASNFSSAGKSVLVVGDSPAEGIGDEFLANTPNYGLIKKLDKAGEAYLIAGKSGYGNISAYNDSNNCLPLLSKITYLEFDKEKVDELVFIFYEGNDLDDNINESRKLKDDPDLNWSRI